MLGNARASEEYAYGSGSIVVPEELSKLGREPYEYSNGKHTYYIDLFKTVARTHHGPSGTMRCVG